MVGFIAGKYLTDDKAGWVEGDWGSGLAFGDQGFVAAFAAGGYLHVSYAATVAAPERASSLMLV